MNVFIDPRFDAQYRSAPIVLVDVGARGGLRSNWLPARPHLRLIGFEPDKHEHAILTARAAKQQDPTTFFDVALHNRREVIQFNITRDRGLSSIFEPDRAFLDTFPDAARFDIIDVQRVEADTLDNLVQAHGVADVDFVKADTQGSELFVLQGAARTLSSAAVGVEVEVEFAPIYKGQPVFADVDAFMRGLGYQLFDLRPVYWKRAAGQRMGGPHGQMIWADTLYLKTIPALADSIAAAEPSRRQAKALKAISVAILYGYFDYALEIARGLREVLGSDDAALVEERLRAGGVPHEALPSFPGKRTFAAAFHRLWQVFLPRDEDAWSVSSAKLGN